MEKYKSISEVVANPRTRLSSGFDALDWLYGYTAFDNGDIRWGLPNRKISLWSGESGVGKSRVAINVAIKLLDSGSKVLYFPTETSLSDFKVDTQNYVIKNPQNFICSGVTSLEEMVDTIYKVKPKFVFVDSVNEIDEFKNGTKQDSRLLMSGDGSYKGFRDVVSEISCHIILIGQLNQNKTIKGGTSLPHLVDISLNLEKVKNKSCFVIKTGVKNRCGRTGNQFDSYWEHNDNGVKCIESGEKYDKTWCDSHNISLLKHPSQMTVKEQVADLREKIVSGEITDPWMIEMIMGPKKSFWQKLFE
jgi:predicted ATP-dependent serine protease